MLSCFCVAETYMRIWTWDRCSPFDRYAVKRGRLRTAEVEWTMGGQLLSLLLLLYAAVALLYSLASAEQGRMSSAYYICRWLRLWSAVYCMNWPACVHVTVPERFRLRVFAVHSHHLSYEIEVISIWHNAFVLLVLNYVIKLLPSSCVVSVENFHFANFV
jgi:hypothetical protein